MTVKHCLTVSPARGAKAVVSKNSSLSASLSLREGDSKSLPNNSWAINAEVLLGIDGLQGNSWIRTHSQLAMAVVGGGFCLLSVHMADPLSPKIQAIRYLTKMHLQPL